MWREAVLAALALVLALLHLSQGQAQGSLNPNRREESHVGARPSIACYLLAIPVILPDIEITVLKW